MTHNNLGKSRLALAITATLCVPLSVSAADQLLVLEEVIVTAQKRAQSLQDVPLAVSALTSAQLQPPRSYGLTFRVNY